MKAPPEQGRFFWGLPIRGVHAAVQSSLKYERMFVFSVFMLLFCIRRSFGLTSGGFATQARGAKKMCFWGFPLILGVV